jgi:hypothetical protein
MTDVPAGGGGETAFPRAFGSGHVNADMAAGDACGKTGLAVRPQRGKVIIFYSLHADGSGDESSLHAACPIRDASLVKWAANKWVWNQEAGFLPLEARPDDRQASWKRRS